MKTKPKKREKNREKEGKKKKKKKLSSSPTLGTLDLCLPCCRGKFYIVTCVRLGEV
jgi:hypothetical protein